MQLAAVLEFSMSITEIKILLFLYHSNGNLEVFFNKNHKKHICFFT